MLRSSLAASSRSSRIIKRYASANTKATSSVVNPTPVASPSAPRQESSVPAGTPLKGLNYLKDKPDPIALPDEEYPQWLWDLLDPKAAGQGQKKGFQAAVMRKGEKVTISKDDLRKKNREAIRASNFLRAQ